MTTKRNYKILIADDDREFHKDIRTALQRDYEFEGVVNEKDLFEEIKNNSKNYDLLLLDLDLAYGGKYKEGLKNIPKLKKIAPHLPIVVATNDDRIQTSVIAMKLGAQHSLCKIEFDIKYWHDVLQNEIKDAKARQKEANLKKVVTSKQTNDNFITRSSKIKQIKEELKKISTLPNVNVLITGETGTGKEIAARYLHRHGARKDKPFVVVNLTAIPSDLLESSLFGHMKGAFTGANDNHIGYAEEANGGVLFLDEIGEIPLSLQAKLLRFIETKTIRPLKGTKDIKLDIQIVTATNRDLEKEIIFKTFRADLYERLKTYEIVLPPLRERSEDIFPLIEFFLNEKSPFELEKVNLNTIFSPEVKQRLKKYDWKGNIRELRNTIESIFIKMQILDMKQATISCLPKKLQEFTHRSNINEEELDHDEMIALRELKAVEYALEETHFNKAEAGKLLGKDDQKLRYMVKLKYYKKYPYLFYQFPNICKAYKLN